MMDLVNSNVKVIYSAGDKSVNQEELYQAAKFLVDRCKEGTDLNDYWEALMNLLLNHSQADLRKCVFKILLCTARMHHRESELFEAAEGVLSEVASDAYAFLVAWSHEGADVSSYFPVWFKYNASGIFDGEQMPLVNLFTYKYSVPDRYKYMLGSLEQFGAYGVSRFDHADLVFSLLNEQFPRDAIFCLKALLAKTEVDFRVVDRLSSLVHFGPDGFDDILPLVWEKHNEKNYAFGYYTNGFLTKHAFYSHDEALWLRMMNQAQASYALNSRKLIGKLCCADSSKALQYLYCQLHRPVDLDFADSVIRVLKMKEPLDEMQLVELATCASTKEMQSLQLVVFETYCSASGENKQRLLGAIKKTSYALNPYLKGLVGYYEGDFGPIGQNWVCNCDFCSKQPIGREIVSRHFDFEKRLRKVQGMSKGEFEIGYERIWYVCDVCQQQYHFCRTVDLGPCGDDFFYLSKVSPFEILEFDGLEEDNVKALNNTINNLLDRQYAELYSPWADVRSLAFGFLSGYYKKMKMQAEWEFLQSNWLPDPVFGI